MEEKKLIAIGESDFKILIKKGMYYIDKTMYIKNIIDNASKITLITRPRRFGKTLNMSMLKYYFDCTQKSNKELFKGLKIMEQGEKYTKEQGNYPCIYLTFNSLGRKDFKQMLLGLKTEVTEACIENAYLLKSEKLLDIEKETFSKYLNIKENDEELIESIKTITKLMYKHFEKPVMLLIDEYDVPLQNAYVEGYYEDAIKFFENFYVTTFKDNQYIEKTVLTGVSRVAKESIFSGANNFKVFTVLDDEFNEDFGITQEEVENALKYYEIEEDAKKVKEWYDGYKIGKKRRNI